MKSRSRRVARAWRVLGALLVLVVVSIAARSDVAAPLAQPTAPACQVLGTTVVFNVTGATCVIRLHVGDLNATVIDKDHHHAQVGFVDYRSLVDSWAFGQVTLANHDPAVNATVHFTMNAVAAGPVAVTLVQQMSGRPELATIAVKIVAKEAKAAWSTSTLAGIQVQFKNVADGFSLGCGTFTPPTTRSVITPPIGECKPGFPTAGVYVVSIQPTVVANDTHIHQMVWAIVEKTSATVHAELNRVASVTFTAVPVGSPAASTGSIPLVYKFAVVLMVAIMIGWALWRLRPTGSRGAGLREPAPGGLLEPQGDVVEEIHDGRDEFQRRSFGVDPRDAILDAWSNFEDSVGNAANPKRSEETSVEFMQRMSRGRRIRAEALGSCYGIYNRARFSRDDMTAEDVARIQIGIENASRELLSMDDGLR